MVNRTKISKEIRRRTGGVSKTGKGTSIKKINIDRPDWIDDPEFQGTAGPYNIKKKVYKPQAKRERRIKRLQKETAASVDKGRKAREAESAKLRGIRVPLPAKVTTKTLEPPLGYKAAKAEAAKKKDAAVQASKMKGIDLEKHQELQDELSYEKRARRAAEKAARDLAEGTRKREEGEYERLEFKAKGGQPKRLPKPKPRKYPKRPWKNPTRSAKAGGRVKNKHSGYQSHDGNKLVSKYYS